MFEDMPADLEHLCAVSVPDVYESSWATYCPPDSDFVNGKEIGSCLGDTFSVNWMEDADKSGAMQESLQNQYVTVRDETSERHYVCQWGDMQWTNLPIGDFEGNLSKHIR